MEQDFKERWASLVDKLTQQFGKRPDLNAILYLIGVRELGKPKKNFTKEEKVHLMHIAVCKVLSESGYYELEGVDQDGWPHWKVVKPLPFIDVFQQETFLGHHVLEYFERENLL